MRFKRLPRQLCLAAAIACAAMTSSVQAADKLSDDDTVWREKIGFNPQVHASVEKSSDADVFARVPFAYYPSASELEVVCDVAAATALLPAGAPKPSGGLSALMVSVFPAVIAPELLAKYPFYYAPAPTTPPDPDKAVATGTIPLDAKGRGRGVIKLPDLPAGNYRVVYEFGDAKLAAGKTFRRTHFEWENCAFGTEHKVYAPFTPVTVDGAKVSIVDRTYTINSLGLFDSVVSKGRELLAEPMKLVALDADGTRLEWQDGKVSGKAQLPDVARFECSAKSAICNLKSTISIEEDGCAKITLTLNPDPRALKPVISRLWLEMALKESEAPLCHMVGMNSMRHNYAGAVPRGGRINWINQSWRPARFEVEPFTGKAPDSYQVWEARNQMHWGSEKWNFAPYVWLGAEERGLAWFGDTIQGYSTDGVTSLQRIFIEPGRVVLRVELFQLPVALDASRTFEFGLQGSPTKPMRPDWRGYNVPGGGGMSVVVFGGFNCADKVPANKDWSIVDKVMEGRKTHQADYAWFAEYAKTHQTLIGGGGAAPKDDLRLVPLEQAQANGQPWLTAVNHFAGREAGARDGVGTTVYYEEHQTSGRYPEVAEFMDEWSDGTFARYRYFDYPLTWGPEIRSANPKSYRDFAVFYANEWMKRGVGIYYDNTYPQVDRNREHFAANGVNWSSSIWGHRDYYKRVWKRSRELMETNGTPLPLHTVGHVTNCQVLPFTTWWDATLGVEQPGQWEPDEKPSADVVKKQVDEFTFSMLPGPSKDKPGRALPYPPDYLRAMEMGRMAGLIPHYRHALRSEDAFGGIGIGHGATDQGKDAAVKAHRQLSDAGMGLVHEIRGGVGGYDNPAVGALRRSIDEFGYGGPGVSVHNYWAAKPFVAVDKPEVKWLAMTREGAPFGLLLLQSYSPDAITTAVGFPEAKFLVDAETRQPFAVDSKGSVSISLPAGYGTRLLYAVKGAGEPTLLPSTSDTLLVDDFELGLGYRLSVRVSGFTVVSDVGKPMNHVLRITAGHPAQNVLRPQCVPPMRDYQLSFKFRLSAIPTESGKGGFLQLGYREADKSRFSFGLGYDVGKDGKARWTVASPLLSLDGGKNEGYQKVVATTTSEAPVDTEWHTMTITIKGTRHQISLDGKPVFEGEDDRNLEGGFNIAPGWGWPKSLTHVEIDDLVAKTVGGK